MQEGQVMSSSTTTEDFIDNEKGKDEAFEWSSLWVGMEVAEGGRYL
jgi:hypothetical protein